MILAYTNPAITRDAFLAEIQRHTDMDNFIKGTYGDGRGKTFKGCSVGCAIESIKRIAKKKYVPSGVLHHDFTETIGVPETIVRLQDRIFEGLPTLESKLFTLRFASAIQTGADLLGVWPKVAPRILREIALPTIQPEFDCMRVVVARIATGWETNWQNESAESAAGAAGAAWGAAWGAAESAASAAWSAARSAESAESAAWSAESAAGAAGAAGAASAAWSAKSAAWIKMSDILCEELATAQVKI